MPQRQPECVRRCWRVAPLGDRCGRWRAGAGLALLLGTFTLFVLLGCKPPVPSAPPAEATTPAEPTAPAPPVPATAPDAAPSDQAAIAELLGQLTQAARKFAAEQQRVPQSLEELVSRGYLTRVPAAPAGKAFTITKQLQVELRNK